MGKCADVEFLEALQVNEDNDCESCISTDILLGVQMTAA
jgi:hypothetical protein